MASTFSTSLKLELQGTGENNGTWGSKNNDTLQRIDEAISGVYSKTLVNGDNTVSVANGVFDESRNAVLVLTGALTSAATVIIPDVDRVQSFVNNTTGSQVVTVRNSAGTGVVLPSNTAALLYCNGTSVGYLAPGVGATGTITFSATVSAAAAVFPLLSGTSATFSDKVSANSVNASVANFSNKVSAGLVVAASVSAVELIATSVTCSVLDVTTTASAGILRATGEVAGATVSANAYKLLGATLLTPKVIVNFDGHPTVSVKNSQGITAVSASTSGAYSVQFTSAFASTGYITCFSLDGRAPVSAQYVQGVVMDITKSTTSISFYTSFINNATFGAVFKNAKDVSLIIYGS